LISYIKGYCGSGSQPLAPNKEYRRETSQHYALTRSGLPVHLSEEARNWHRSHKKWKWLVDVCIKPEHPDFDFWDARVNEPGTGPNAASRRSYWRRKLIGQSGIARRYMPHMVPSYPAERQCRHCCEIFNSWREDAVYCNPNCGTLHRRFWRRNRGEPAPATMDKLRKLQHRRHHRTDDPRACAYCTETFTPNKPTNSEFCCWNCRCGHQNFHRRNRNLPPDVVASKFEKLQQKRQMRAFLADLNMTLD
jgi:hypothetical protein